MGKAYRFEDKVAVAGPDECWLWRGPKMKNGYGTFSGGRNKRLVHREAWRRAFGKIPKGLLVCHKCDVRACCNPAHLFLGTYKDNTQDMLAKGRDGMSRRFGENSPKHVLTDELVKQIRESVRAGVPGKAWAIKLGTHPATIMAAVHGKTWKHVPNPIEHELRTGRSRRLDVL